MGKGRYLKAAERACAGKARFETHAAAEAHVEGRYGAYLCPVCGGFHLTSGRGDRPPVPEPPKREPPGPKLGDLDWSAVLSPPDSSTPNPATPENVDPAPSPQPLSPGGARGVLKARCVGPCGRDGRVALVIAGRLVKSRPVARELRGILQKGIGVEVEGDPPTVAGLVIGSPDGLGGDPSPARSQRQAAPPLAKNGRATEGAMGRARGAEVTSSM